ncbi:MAG TPA: protein kinase [Polyangiaceae bacterium]
MDFVPPVIAGRYEIVRLIAQGGMGTVYEARHTGTGKRCAVKLLSSPALSNDVELVRRFFQEARACSVLENDHVVEVFDSGVDSESGYAFMVMELLRGEDLEQVLRQNAPLEPSVAIRLMLQATTGMAKAHHMGILHRDLKPANLFLSVRDSGEVVVKILDFGVAKVRVESSLDIATGTLTRTGRLLGTPLYMSPEQIRNDGALDARTDVWSLGVVLFEMLTGGLPYSRKTSFGELMVSILTTDLPLLQDVAPWVDPDLAAVTHRAMSRALEHRFPDAEALRLALATLAPLGSRVEQREIQSISEQRRARVASRLSLPPAELLRLTASERPSSTPPRSRRREVGVLAGAGVFGVVAALATSGMMQRAPEERPSAPPSSGALPLQRSAEPLVVPATSSPPTERRYAVRVAEGVSVQVRGAPVEVQAGRITLAGPVGETFDVRIARGEVRRELRVVLAAEGAVPDFLDVPKPEAIRRPSSKPVTSTPRPAASASATGNPPSGGDGLELTESTHEFEVPPK